MLKLELEEPSKLVEGPYKQRLVFVCTSLELPL